MYSDLIEWAAFVCVLALVFVLWRSRLTGSASKILRHEAAALNAAEGWDFAVDQVDPSSEVTCVLAEQGDWDFFDLLECFEFE